MDIKPLAHDLVALCKQGKNKEAIQKHYSPAVVSSEAFESPNSPMPRTITGTEPILAKAEWWGQNHTIHSASVGGPYFHAPDKFAVLFKYDITAKANNQRMQIEEVAVYTVKDNKIVHEAFYYDM